MPENISSSPVDRKPPLILGVKRSTWRMHDPAAEDADAAFETVRKKVLVRDKYTCRYCQMRTLREEDQTKNGKFFKGRFAGYFEVHHIDDDHHNNHPDNLLTVCPFCHSVFHCGNAGHREAGSIIWAPWIRQEDLNITVHVLFILMCFEHPNEAEIKIAEESRTQDALKFSSEMGRAARERYESLQSFGDLAEKNLGAGMSNAAVLGESLMALANRNESAYLRRSVFLGGARFLPDFSYYLRPVRYWLQANNYKQNMNLIHADKLKSHYDRFEKMAQRFLCGGLVTDDGKSTTAGEI
ncbi:HNH endonuclease [Acidithiobacillus thiooxidans]|uniref:HNH endonuclease signature motif containing protein n=1 Tax=Acidithiobacillus thiooxidans TaxID=930 RepID=UPI001C069D18|nr:HNH endonuclease signature motif containing protein [Acidithiobacillus thiooxidans]MBU2794442.1 HNH endonuclease [Acidithiobacillus thiooxidans]